MTAEVLLLIVSKGQYETLASFVWLRSEKSLGNGQPTPSRSSATVQNFAVSWPGVSERSRLFQRQTEGCVCQE
ncbi:hypothetical protein QQF64_022906 [Cirrhinus molitorella]|uniref:Uncharacterized protein n=2 Tax=Cirrhinus molitorella TaxID=172907 RepID=A0AA88P867_9TELE|nr:hypothetical protein Q8A67_025345 [Cirrhinus molitorella]